MGLKHVIFEKGHDIHETESRKIMTIVNGDIPNYTPAQIRLVEIKDSRAVLGNHWRDYGEVYAVVGKATITLEDIETKEQCVYELETSDRLFVPPQIGLRLTATKGTVIVVCAQKAIRDDQTHKYVLTS